MLNDFLARSEIINNYALKFTEELPCDINNAQDFCINSLFDMIRGTALTITSLIKVKSAKDSLILLRTQIERFIKLKKLCDDSSYAQEFINQTERQRLKYIEIAMSNGDESRNNPHYQALKNIIDEKDFEKLKASVSEQNPELPTWELAKQTGFLTDYYSTGYRFYSEVVHCSSSQLDDCLCKKDGKILLVPYESQSLDELLPAIMLSSHILLESISITSQVKRIDVKNEISKLRDRSDYEKKKF